MPSADSLGSDENPLRSDSARDWEALLEAMGIASLLLVVEKRMSDSLKRSLSPEDIFQEALLHAWRDRERVEWRGLTAYRSWFLTVIDHRIDDLAERESALKRGAGQRTSLLSELRAGSTSGAAQPGPAVSTTPSRIAGYREQADAMRAALKELPDELGEVVHLRQFEELSTEAVAEQLGIGVSAVKHRFRKGAAIYRRQLERELASRSRG